MSSPAAPDPIVRHARAAAVFEAWLVARKHGGAASDEELLAAHDDVRDLLGAMIEGERRAQSTWGATGGTGAPPDFVGLPDPGQDFGAYRIVATLGQGGMGSVFLAEHRGLGRRVALKLIRPERLFSETARERFWREAKAVSRLDHPNICPVYEVDQVHGVPYMAMRYIEGESLAARVARMHRESTESGEPTTGVAATMAVIRMFEDLARAVHHAHERGIVHRDIKPANVMLEEDGRPVLVDFGLAQLEDAELGLTMTGDVPGTPLYMAPEQIEPRGVVPGPTTDVYALGVTLYECLTLRQMVQGASMREVFDAVLYRDAAPPSRCNRKVPTDLDVVCAKATDKDPLRRYRSALELAEDLRRVRCHEPIRARRAGVLLRVRRWAQRDPWVASFLALLLSAVVGLALAFGRAETARAEFHLLEAVPVLRDAVTAESALHDGAWTWHRHRAAMAAWLEEHGEPLARRAVVLRDFVDTKRKHGVPDGEGVRFGDRAEQFLYDTTVALVADLAAFLAPADGAAEGALPRIRRLLAQGDADGARRDDAAWRDVAEVLRADSRFAQVAFSAQHGLRPLGCDPRSGLPEFLLEASGTVPMRDIDIGEYVITEETGIVLVLLPGGWFEMGSQNEDRAEPRYDPDAEPHERPVWSILLDGFLMSKYEMTQGQWMRLTGGEQPSGGRPDKDHYTLAHPVENMRWERCGQVLGWFGMELPTEAQWEYACRGGRDTPWWTGNERQTLIGRVNLADQAAARARQTWSAIARFPELDDGFAAHAPVDWFEPNPFGLFQVHGNVWEWCRDQYGMRSYAMRPAPGDGLRHGVDVQAHVVRGGSYRDDHMEARCSARDKHNSVTASLGLRPMRRWKP